MPFYKQGMIYPGFEVKEPSGPEFEEARRLYREALQAVKDAEAREYRDRIGPVPEEYVVKDSGERGIERHPNSARFHELVKEIAELHDRKQADYGAGDDPFANVRASEEFGVASWVGALIRLNDKITRLKAFAQRGSLANESAADSMQDIAVYALIALVLYEQESNG